VFGNPPRTDRIALFERDDELLRFVPVRVLLQALSRSPTSLQRTLGAEGGCGPVTDQTAPSQIRVVLM
jgi:hypothetical protein